MMVSIFQPKMLRELVSLLRECYSLLKLTGRMQRILPIHYWYVFVGAARIPELWQSILSRRRCGRSTTRFVPAVISEQCGPQEESNTLCYCGGYLIRSPRNKISKSAHPLKDALVLCLQDLVEGDHFILYETFHLLISCLWGRWIINQTREKNMKKAKKMKQKLSIVVYH